MRLVKNQGWCVAHFTWALFLATALALPAAAFTAGRSGFYRSPNSAFASGTELNERLKSQTEHELSVAWMKVFNFQISSHLKNKSENTGWLLRREVVCASDLTLEVVTAAATVIRATADWSALPIQTLDPNSVVSITEAQAPWLRIVTRTGTGFIPSQGSAPRPGHWGAALARRSTSLRQLPNTQTREMLILNAGDRARITGIAGEWLQLQVQRGRNLFYGYGSSRDFLTRLDFAKSVQLKGEEGDLAIVRNLPGKIVLHDGRVKSWTQIASFRADDSLCLSRIPQTVLRSEPSETSAIVARIPAQAPLKNMAELDIRWAQAQLPKHGLVWWKKPVTDGVVENKAEPGSLVSVNSERNSLTTQQLFRRKVTRFVRYEYPTGSLYLVSAGGLFRSHDGHLWNPIAGFADQNYPIAITKGGWVIAGSYVSTDQAQTFEPFVKWERILNLVARMGWPSPKRVGILNVSASELGRNMAVNQDPRSQTDSTRVLLGLDLGKQRHLTIATDDWGQNWGVANSTRALQMPRPSPAAPDHPAPLDLPPSNQKWKWVSKPATALTGL